MTISEFRGFLTTWVPAHVEVLLGEDNMLQLKDHEAGSEAYIKYSGGLDFSLQGVRNGEKSDTKTYSFKNEYELVNILGAMVLELLDGERRV